MVDTVVSSISEALRRVSSVGVNFVTIVEVGLRNLTNFRPRNDAPVLTRQYNMTMTTSNINNVEPIGRFSNNHDTTDPRNNVTVLNPNKNALD